MPNEFRPHAQFEVAPRQKAARTSTREAVLAMLSLGPMSGYGIRATIARSIGNFWQESFGQIYPALKSLVADGLARSLEESQAGERPRNVYAITDRGRARLESWLAEPCERQVPRDELLLKLFSGANGRPEVLAGHVETLRASLAEDLARYKHLETMLPELRAGVPSLPYMLMTVRNGIWTAEARLHWCEETLQALRKLEATAPVAEQPMAAVPVQAEPRTRKVRATQRVRDEEAKRSSRKTGRGAGQ